MTKFKSLAIAALAALLLSSCDGEPRQIKQDFDRSGEELRITVIFHDSEAALNRAYTERFGGSRREKKLGFAVFANPGNRPYWCEIHTTRPKNADDEPMDTMGHELPLYRFGSLDGDSRCDAGRQQGASPWQSPAA